MNIKNEKVYELNPINLINNNIYIWENIEIL